MDANAIVTLAFLKQDYGLNFIGSPNGESVVIGFENEDGMDRAACYLVGDESPWVVDDVARAVISD